MRALLRERYAAFHLGPKPFGREGETKAQQTVDRWRRGYCGAAFANGGLMAPWWRTDEVVPPSRWGVRGE